jgi:hypothetical protein
MSDDLKDTKRLMGALGRMPPKPHAEMRLGKSSGEERTNASPKTTRDRASKAKNKKDDRPKARR